MKKEANRGYGQYECAICHEIVAPTIREGRRKVTNIFVDHIAPIIDPQTGFVSWDETINRMFCEKDNLQLLCGSCHDKKTLAERAEAKAAREKNKDIEDIE